MGKRLIPPEPMDIQEVALRDALEERYLAYALSTIMHRALPDARDGLKPVHRRILYGMRLLRLDPGTPFKKSAKIVGDVMGSFHPHGDQSIYDALVRLAQDFASRYPLVDGQGNFGNIDGDNAAAYRYTEARMTEVARLLLEGIDEDAVEFRPNYDGQTKEPVVLPGAFPNLLANGAQGIAVGMATAIPPHNAAELCDAALHLIDKPATKSRGLLRYVKGPDFPTGGIVVDSHDSIAEAYETGRGAFRVRAKWHREEGARGAWDIIVTEIPWLVQKSRLIERIAELLNEKKLLLVGDIRDESAEDVRIVIEPKTRNADPEVLMETLFKQTELESRISLNLNVLVKGRIPKVLGLAECLREWLDHLRDVLLRRANHRKGQIEHRLEVLGGYLIAYLNIDKVIKIIRTEDEPKPVLIKTFKLTEIQAEAILNMRLRSLRKLEEMEIRGEHTSLTKEQAELNKLLKSEKLKSERLVAELREVDAKFGLKTELGKRRTQIAKAAEVAEMTALAEHVEERANQVEREPITVVCSAKGWLRALTGHKEQSKEDKYREGDRARFWFHAQTTDQIMLLATDGRFFTLDGSKLPGGRGNGEAIRTFVDLPPDADIVTMFVHVPGRKLLVAATSGHGFITSEDDAVAMTKNGKRVMNVKPGIEATVARPVEGDHVAVVGENRKLLIFALSEVPEMARGQGVYLQRYKDGALLDAVAFVWKEGLVDENNRSFPAAELKEWKGERSQAGRIVPRGWAKSGKFAGP
jgi:topoisomerase-4 subunit A